MNMHSIHKNRSGFVACRRRKAQLTPPTSKSRRVILDANDKSCGCACPKKTSSHAKIQEEEFKNLYEGPTFHSLDEKFYLFARILIYFSRVPKKNIQYLDKLFELQVVGIISNVLQSVMIFWEGIKCSTYFLYSMNNLISTITIG